MKRLFGRHFFIATVALPSLALTGCLSAVSTGDVMVLPQVGGYERLALVGLEAPAEELFRSMFLETFPGKEFADREPVLDIYPEEDIRLGGVGNEIRSRMRSSLGVQGIMVLTWDDSGMGGTLDWVLEITDTDTGAITGTVVAHVRKEPLARGVEFSELERRAFDALISKLEERLSRS